MSGYQSPINQRSEKNGTNNDHTTVHPTPTNTSDETIPLAKSSTNVETSLLETPLTESSLTESTLSGSSFHDISFQEPSPPEPFLPESTLSRPSSRKTISMSTNIGILPSLAEQEVSGQVAIDSSINTTTGRAVSNTGSPEFGDSNKTENNLERFDVHLGRTVIITNNRTLTSFNDVNDVLKLNDVEIPIPTVTMITTKLNIRTRDSNGNFRNVGGDVIHTNIPSGNIQEDNETPMSLDNTLINTNAANNNSVLKSDGIKNSDFNGNRSNDDVHGNGSINNSVYASVFSNLRNSDQHNEASRSLEGHANTSAANNIGFNNAVKNNSEFDGHIRNNSEFDGSIRNNSELDGNIRNNSELDGNIRHNSEFDGSIRNNSELDGNIRNNSEFDGNIRHNSEFDGNIRNNSGFNGNIRNNSEFDGNSGFCVCGDVHSNWRDGDRALNNFCSCSPIGYRPREMSTFDALMSFLGEAFGRVRGALSEQYRLYVEECSEGGHGSRPEPYATPEGRHVTSNQTVSDLTSNQMGQLEALHNGQMEQLQKIQNAQMEQLQDIQNGQMEELQEIQNSQMEHLLEIQNGPMEHVPETQDNFQDIINHQAEISREQANIFRALGDIRTAQESIARSQLNVSERLQNLNRTSGNHFCSRPDLSFYNFHCAFSHGGRLPRCLALNTCSSLSLFEMLDECSRSKTHECDRWS